MGGNKKNFIFTPVLGEEKKKYFIFTPAYWGEKIKLYFFPTTIEKEGKYILSNDWLPGSFSYWYGESLCQIEKQHWQPRKVIQVRTF